MLPVLKKLGMLWHMDIRICKKNEWRAISLTRPNKEFLQSWEWGDFQERAGKKVIRMQFYDNDAFLAQVQGIIHNFGRFFRYLYVPRVSNLSHRIVTALTRFCKKEGYIFIRCEAVHVPDCIHSDCIFRTNTQPKDTLLLDLCGDEESLLSQMHRKTRYNVRLGMRKNLSIKKEKNSDVFWLLHKQTMERDGFGGHSKSYYENMLVSPNVTQMTAYFDGTPVASNIFVVYNKVYTYLHGSSANGQRNLMAPYVLQWHGMREAREIGCSTYDFWGVAPEVADLTKSDSLQKFHRLSWDPDHSLSGVTRFKAGFGGKRKTYPQAFDIVCNSKVYTMYRLAKRVKGVVI